MRQNLTIVRLIKSPAFLDQPPFVFQARLLRRISRANPYAPVVLDGRGNGRGNFDQQNRLSLIANFVRHKAWEGRNFSLSSNVLYIKF